MIYFKLLRVLFSLIQICISNSIFYFYFSIFENERFKQIKKDGARLTSRVQQSPARQSPPWRSGT